MAIPRVFMSSTCYDLAEVRDTLVDFIVSFGFESVLSERGDVFYHPDIHTHDSCLNEVGNCQLMILIVGGRFGGEYVADTSKSVVNAEYAVARERKIPVFTFVKRSVYSDHFVYQKNKGGSALHEIVFPSIDDNEQATRIFDFIDEVRSSPVNNGVFPFDFARDITALLRKQWSGMFFDFLEHRSSADQLATATSLLKNIAVAGDKVEELVKSLYRHIDVAGADERINTVEQHSIARQFFKEYVISELRSFNLDITMSALLNTPMHGNWYEYITAATDGIVKEMVLTSRDGDEYKAVFAKWGNGAIIVDYPDDPDRRERSWVSDAQRKFEVVKKLSKDELKKVLLEFDAFQTTESGVDDTN